MISPGPRYVAHRTPRQVGERMTPADRRDVCVPCWTAGQFMPDGEINCTLHFYAPLHRGSLYYVAAGPKPSSNCRNEYLCECIAADLLVPWVSLTEQWADGDIARLAALYEVELWVIRFQFARYGGAND